MTKLGIKERLDLISLVLIIIMFFLSFTGQYDNALIFIMFLFVYIRIIYIREIIKDRK